MHQLIGTYVFYLPIIFESSFNIVHNRFAPLLEILRDICLSHNKQHCLARKCENSSVWGLCWSSKEPSVTACRFFDCHVFHFEQHFNFVQIPSWSMTFRDDVSTTREFVFVRVQWRVSRLRFFLCLFWFLFLCYSNIFDKLARRFSNAKFT